MSLYFTAWSKCEFQEAFSEKAKEYNKKGGDGLCSARQLWNFVKNQRRVYTQFENNIKSGAGQDEVDELKAEKNSLQRHAC